MSVAPIQDDVLGQGDDPLALGMSQQTDLADLIMIGIMVMIAVIYPRALCHEKAEDKQCAWNPSHLDFRYPGC